MRLFIGIDMGTEVAAGAASLISQLRSRAERLAPRARITWVSPKHIHLTVRFIGEVAEGKVRAIRGVLDRPFEVAPFELTVADLSAFPPRGRPRVFWAGLIAGRDAMLALERQVTLRLEQAGVPPDEKPYRPHITLARIREAAGLRSAALFEGLSHVVLGTTCVETSTLFESRPSSKGPEYVALQQTRLVAG